MKEFIKYTFLIFFRPKNFFSEKILLPDFKKIFFWILYLSIGIGSLNFAKDIILAGNKKLLDLPKEVIISLIEAIFIILIYSFLIHNILSILEKQKKEFKKTVNSIAFSYISFFFEFIPYIGDIISVILFFTFCVISIKYYLDIKYAKSFLTCWIAFFLIFILFGFSGLVYYFFLYGVS